jgi:hypothetical protein
LQRRARIASNGAGDKLNGNDRSTTCLGQVFTYSHYGRTPVQNIGRISWA